VIEYKTLKAITIINNKHMMPRNNNEKRELFFTKKDLLGSTSKRLAVHFDSNPLVVHHENKPADVSSYLIPSLAVINHMVAAVPANVRSQFEKTVLVACQHNLETTVTLYQAIKKLGIKKIYSVGKCYSDAEIIKKK